MSVTHSLLFGSPGHPTAERDPEDVEADARWWRAANAQAKADGCPCGRPATRVSRYSGTIGDVPAEVWTCSDHERVTKWTRSGDAPWAPQPPRSDDPWLIGTFDD